MTYLSHEQSVDDGAPVELYTFRYEHNVWYYINSDEKILLNSKEYLPLTIKRSEITVDPKEPFGEVHIDAPIGTPVIELFRVSPPSGAVNVLIERVHLTDPDKETAIVFKGNIVNVEKDFTFGRMLCQSGGYIITRVGLRKHYQNECPYMFFSGECGVNRDLYKVEGTVSGIAGTTIDVVNCIHGDDDYFAGGYIEYTHSALGTIERIAVSGSVGSNGKLTLFSHPVGINNGDNVEVFVGCDRSFQTCANKFGNAENFGGLPFIPTKNPFTDNPSY